MKRALSLARRAAGGTSPNPLVGAVIVRDGRIVGEGYHRHAGLPHAEVEALRDARERAAGATMYVTLEPCNHHGRTPPCTEAIIAGGLRRVVAAVTDHNPRVRGSGLKRLREAGIEVNVGVREGEARTLNEPYFKYIATGRPLFILKYAMSADGKMASTTGASRWISGERSRALVHRLRSRVDAIMVGIGTALADDPQLTARHPRGRDPLRVIVDSRLRLPATARMFRQQSTAATLVASTKEAPSARRAALEAAGAEVIALPDRGGSVDLPALAAELGRRGITSVLLEGGPTLAAAALEADLVDRVMIFMAPIILGGKGSPGPVAGVGRDSPAEAWSLVDTRTRRLGADVLLEGRIARV